jgi:hypothetical protein
MFIRLRWFSLGVMTTMGATAFLFTRVRRLRERVTAQSVARAAALTMAGGIESVGRRLGGARGAASAEG